MKLSRRLICILLVCMLSVVLCACGGDTDVDDKKNDGASTGQEVENSEEQSSEEKASKFEVKVVDASGNAVKGVMIQICKDTCIPAMTDDNGIATFNIEVTEGHKLSVLSCPEGYVYNGDAEVYLEDGATEYTVELSGAE